MALAYEVHPTQPSPRVRVEAFFRQILGQSKETADQSLDALAELDALLATDDIDLFFDLLG